MVHILKRTNSKHGSHLLQLKTASSVFVQLSILAHEGIEGNVRKKVSVKFATAADRKVITSQFDPF